jgi:hypothetical protein
MKQAAKRPDAVRFLVLLVLPLSIHAGCGPRLDPSQAFDAFASAVEAGDYAAASSHLTARSAPVFDAVVTIARSAPKSDTADPSRAVPAGALSGSARAVGIADGGGDFALLIVEANAPHGVERAQVIMRLEDGHWRLDLPDTESLWNRNWTLSGGRNRGPPGFIEIDGMPL